jgi:hypothetical protein
MLSYRVDEGAQSDYTLYQVNKFGEIKRRLHSSTDDLLKRNWQMIEAMARKNKVAPDAGAVAKSFLAIPDVQDALRRVCDMWQMPQQPEQQAPASILVRAPSRRAPDMESPPEGKCCKQKPTLGTWPSRYAMIKPNGSGGMGLYVYAAQGDRNPRATSIETLQGCTFMKAIENFTFSVRRPTLPLSSCVVLSENCIGMFRTGRLVQADNPRSIGAVRPLCFPRPRKA